MAQWASEYKRKSTDSAAAKLEKQEQLLFDARSSLVAQWFSKTFPRVNWRNGLGNRKHT